MNTNCLLRLVSILAVMPVLLTSQTMQRPDPTTLNYRAEQAAPETTGEHSLATPATINVPAPAAALVFVAMTPCRVVDTQAGAGFTGAFGPPSLIGGASRTFPILSSTSCSIPAAAQAYSFDITVLPHGPLGYVTAYPTGLSSPVAAVAVESPQGVLASATGIVPAGTNGSIDIYASNGTDIVIDVDGYYASLNSVNFNNTAFNTALGNGALASNTTGDNNTAGGFDALSRNATGGDNTATGYNALGSNTTGAQNTAIGSGALQSNTLGGNNTANGVRALYSNTTGLQNVASGTEALFFNTTGISNTASGMHALDANTTGNSNSASGFGALQNNTTGNYNTASGDSALFSNTTGDSNIAIGQGAAVNAPGANSNSIYIASKGSTNDNSGTIRIGTTGTQTSFFVAGVSGITTSVSGAVPVVIDSNGQLGTMSSSRRFKEDIEDMGEASSGLLRLRPVTFHYKQAYADGSKPLDYGLIAEEVAEVYPDLVARDKDGQIQTVQYQKLTPLLLSEVQKQAAEIRSLENRLAALEALMPPAQGPIP